MKNYALAAALIALPLTACEGSFASTADASEEAVTERNKRLAREFYEKLWFEGDTEAYADYVADEYVVHDIGPDKGSTQPAIRQKEIADRFHALGEMSGEFDYQIAEGDKVATRWHWTLLFSDDGPFAGAPDVERLPIINVFRFNEEGKIVEIWNHRHDIDAPQFRGPPPSQQ